MAVFEARHPRRDAPAGTWVRLRRRCARHAGQSGWGHAPAPTGARRQAGCCWPQVVLVSCTEAIGDRRVAHNYGTRKQKGHGRKPHHPAPPRATSMLAGSLIRAFERSAALRLASEGRQTGPG